MSVHVAQLIADAIYQFVGTTPMRHPVDPEKCNRALGFPARITGLYQFYRVSVAPSEVIRPPVTRAFIEKYCMPRQAQGEAPQQPGMISSKLQVLHHHLQRSIACLGRHRVRHHSSPGMISSKLQVLHHHLQSLPLITCGDWSGIYDM